MSFFAATIVVGGPDRLTGCSPRRRTNVASGLASHPLPHFMAIPVSQIAGTWSIGSDTERSNSAQIIHQDGRKIKTPYFSTPAVNPA
jgi:hypothetical protein